MLAYLDGAFADGDAGEIADALGVVAHARGMSQLAEATGLTRQALYKALSSDGNPEFATVLRRQPGVRHRPEGHPGARLPSPCWTRLRRLTILPDFRLKQDQTPLSATRQKAWRCRRHGCDSVQSIEPGGARTMMMSS
ncbi:addiction module antidote protein [Bradyrhizobium sp.]|uniref:addiction module antidote protein n=1 Tax=Bradyrhizobium sp. TaxID=376 RepID=UPI003C701138